ncbi:hypothetical protein CANINC_000788 [Pichia inconspicua]|uniref:Uncharacterized protein n=1 Tax=Pichia inconspicua TaxID=52247 RepID=A0A4T0X5R4_9ASCO|nr:hypothetical protein CANINC_000788 [[Candida] inconspicua]
MTIFVASLFLPYTVHFELNISQKSAIIDDTSIAEIFETVNSEGQEERYPKKPYMNRKTGRDIRDVSIIQSMSSMNLSQSNASFHSVDSEDEDNNQLQSESQYSSYLDTNNSETDPRTSFSSTSSLVEPKSKSASSTDPPHYSTHLSVRPVNRRQASNNSLQKVNSHTSNHSLNDVSVEDFFFKNPNISRPVMNYSHSVGNVSAAVPFQYGLNEGGKSTENITTLLKPKPFIRSTTPQAKVNEIPQEPQLSSMRINRTHQHSNLRNYKTSSMLELDQQIEGVVDSDKKPFYDTYTKQLANEEREVLNRSDYIKVSPFGGFSKTHIFSDSDSSIFDKAPWKITNFEKGNGSLINSVKLAREQSQDDFKWIGTLSIPSNIIPDDIKINISSTLKSDYNSNAIFLDDELFEGHYKSFCKQILWPIFHYQIPDNPKSNAFENHSWEYYEKVNQIFAEKIAKEYKDGDTVWIHDYHLMLVPNMLRKLIPHAKIGFFLHVSFPSSEVFRCLAQRKHILEGVLGADCVTFQNEEYLGHFLQSSNRLLLADFNSVGVNYKDRLTVVSYNPIGLDFESLNKKIQSYDVQSWKNMIGERWSKKKLIVSKDKLDRIRGLKEKLLAYERFLNDHPDFIYNTTMLLICPSGSNNDEDYVNEIFSIIERINSMTENISIDQPIVLLNQDIAFDQYLALLGSADVFIVSTLREGMNLTCHEFVCASQEKHSPLILSEFVGSASVLTEGSLISNPYNIKEVSEQIYQALNMSESEKEERWDKMFKQVLNNDSKTWVHKCLTDINNSYGYSTLSQNTKLVTKLTKTIYEGILNDIPHNGKRLYVLNLDDMADNFSVHGKTIHSMQTQFILRTLSELSSNPNNTVYIFSMCQRTELARSYGRNPSIGLIAESGGLLRQPNSNDWLKIIDESEKVWMSSAVDVIKAFSERIPGSYLEVEECSIIFHTESANNIDKDHKDGLIGDLITHINELFEKDYNVHAFLSKGVVIVKEINLIFRALEYITEQSSKNLFVKVPTSGSGYDSPVLQSPLTNHSPITSPVQLSGISGSSASVMSNMLMSEIATSRRGSSAKSDFMCNANQNSFQFVFICGTTGKIDEELYTFFNGLAERAGIESEHIMTVCVGDTSKGRTCAKYSLLGINNLMTLLN